MVVKIRLFVVVVLVLLSGVVFAAQDPVSWCKTNSNFKAGCTKYLSEVRQHNLLVSFLDGEIEKLSAYEKEKLICDLRN